MDCLRSLLPKGYPRAPPSSPQSSPASAATARSSESANGDTPSPPTPDEPNHDLNPSLPDEIDPMTSSERLSPPISVYDNDEPPPFIPDEEDHTSLDQMEGGTPKLNADQTPRLYKHRSAASLGEETQTRSRSHPSTPHPGKNRTERAIHMRRSSMPASALRRPSKPHNTPKDESPCVRFSVSDQYSGAPEVVYAGTSPEIQDDSSLAEFSNWNIGYEDEGLTAEDNCDIETAVSIPRLNSLDPDFSENDIPTQEDDEYIEQVSDSQWRSMSRSSQHSVRTHKLQRADSYPSLAIPLEIRLRRASTSDPMNARRRSLPATTPFYTEAPASSSQTRNPGNNPPDIVSPKSLSAGLALTHAYIHMFLPGESDGPALAAPESTRRISSTFQVVRSKNSVYEVIWEDELAISTMQSAVLTSSCSSSSSASPISPTPYHSSHTAVDDRATKSDHVDTKLAAWSWDSGMEHSHAPKHRTAPGRSLTPSRSSEKFSDRSLDDQLLKNPSQTPSVLPTTGEEVSGLLESSVNGESTSDETESDNAGTLFQPSSSDEAETDDAGNGNRAAPINLSTPPSSRLLTPSSKTPNPTVGPILTLPRQALSAKQRRDLLGNRKISHLPSEGDHFAIVPRDSLVLAHKRILHDAPEQSQTDPHRLDARIKELKRMTWSLGKPRKNSDPSDAKDDEDDGSCQTSSSPGDIDKVPISSAEDSWKSEVVDKRNHGLKERSSEDAPTGGGGRAQGKHLLGKAVHN